MQAVVWTRVKLLVCLSAASNRNVAHDEASVLSVRGELGQGARAVLDQVLRASFTECSETR